MGRRFFLVCLVALLAAAEALGMASEEVNEKKTIVLPQSTVNNEMWAFNLNQPRPASATKPPADFVQDPVDKAELFRVAHTKDAIGTATIEGSLDADGNFEFVHATNPTIRRPFSLQIWKIDLVFTPDENAWNAWIYWGEFTYTLTTQDLVAQTRSANGISFPMDAAKWESKRINSATPRDVCTIYHQYQARIVMEDWDGPKEPGDYYADLTVTPDGGVPVPIRIKGYYGEDFAPPAEMTTFDVAEGASTHDIDLAGCDGQTSYEIAKVNFYSHGTQEKPIDAPADAGMYSIYISPTSDYDSAPTGEPSPYHFILDGTEGATRSIINTMWYDFDFPADDGTGTPPFAPIEAGSWVYEKKVPVQEISRQKRYVFMHEIIQCIYPLNSLPVSIRPYFKEGQAPERMGQGNYHSDIWFIVVPK